MYSAWRVPEGFLEQRLIRHGVLSLFFNSCYINFVYQNVTFFEYALYHVAGSRLWRRARSRSISSSYYIQKTHISCKDRRSFLSVISRRGGITNLVDRFQCFVSLSDIAAEVVGSLVAGMKSFDQEFELVDAFTEKSPYCVGDCFC